MLKVLISAGGACGVRDLHSRVTPSPIPIQTFDFGPWPWIVTSLPGFFNSYFMFKSKYRLEKTENHLTPQSPR